MKLVSLLILSLFIANANAQQQMTKEKYMEELGAFFTEILKKEVSFVEPRCKLQSDYDYFWFFSDKNLHNNVKKVACKKFDSFLKVMDKMDGFLNGYMKTNSHFKDVNIVLQEKFDNAFYSKGMGELITMPNIFVQYGKNGKEYSKHPKYLYPIVMHEYGHYIIEKNIGKHFDSYIKKSENNPAAFLIRSAIHEFVADVIAVSMTKNPNTIRDSLYHTGTDQKSKYGKMSTRLRSFDNHENSLKAIGTRLRNLGSKMKAVIAFSEGRVTTAAKSIELRVHFGGHNLLTPTRHHVYKYYLSNPRFNKNKGKLISLIMKAMSKKMMTINPEDFRKAARKNAAGAYIKINKMFIEAIDSI